MSWSPRWIFDTGATVTLLTVDGACATTIPCPRHLLLNRKRLNTIIIKNKKKRIGLDRRFRAVQGGWVRRFRGNEDESYAKNSGVVESLDSGYRRELGIFPEECSRETTLFFLKYPIIWRIFLKNIYFFSKLIYMRIYECMSDTINMIWK